MNKRMPSDCAFLFSEVKITLEYPKILRKILNLNTILPLYPQSQMQSSHNGLKTKKPILGTIQGPIFSQNKYLLKTNFCPNKDHKRYLTQFDVKRQHGTPRLYLQSLKPDKKDIQVEIKNIKTEEIVSLVEVCNGKTLNFSSEMLR